MMLNDRNELPDDHEENEYHFSDEDVSFEVETESSKPAAQPKESVMNRLGQSKRMLISLGVFAVLVFVIYKVITPATTTVPTEISTPVVTAAPTNIAQPMTQQAPAVATAPPVTPTEATPAVEVAVTPPVAPAPMAPAQEQQTMPQQAVATMPPVIAVQQPTPEITAPPAMGAPGMTQQVTTTTTTTNVPAPAAPVENQTAGQTPVDAAAAYLAQTNERLMSQLQSDYTQKISEYATQNKMLQEQMQSLSARVSTMEAQLSQLVQALTPPTNQTTAPAPAPMPSVPTSMAPPKAVIPAPEVKVAYSVQAIIPGRAWLRSENGEAVTVAEGDTIKDLGRVTKIDPYDGVVEVNTGNKSILLSYGNGNE